MDFDFDGRCFGAIENSATGEMFGATLFEHHPVGSQLLALMGENGELDMRYDPVNLAGALMTGVIRSIPTRLPDRRYRVEETWRWTCGERSAGGSVLEEVVD